MGPEKSGKSWETKEVKELKKVDSETSENVVVLASSPSQGRVPKLGTGVRAVKAGAMGRTRSQVDFTR